MFKKHRILLAGVLAFAVAAAGSYALAASGGPAQPTHPTASKNIVARHIDYNISLQVNGDLSSVSPKLKGVLPLNLSVNGGTDVKKDAGGPAAQGSIRISGLDSLIQKITATHGSGGTAPGAAALGSLASGALSDVQFTEVNQELYLKLAGTWYEAGGLGGCHGPGPAGTQAVNHHPDAQRSLPGVKSVFPGGAQALLKNVKQVGQENVDGIDTTHYTATLDLDKAISEEVAALNKSGRTAQANRLEAARGQITGAFRQLDLEWWVDGDHHIRQTKLVVEVVPAALASLAGNKDGKAATLLKDVTSVKLDAAVKFSRFGQDFQVAAPGGDVKQLGDLFGLAGIRKPARGGSRAWVRPGRGHFRHGARS